VREGEPLGVFGWQGIVPAKVRKMGADIVDMTLQDLVRPRARAARAARARAALRADARPRPRTDRRAGAVRWVRVA
jgi:hypothetical protein